MSSHGRNAVVASAPCMRTRCSDVVWFCCSIDAARHSSAFKPDPSRSQKPSTTYVPIRSGEMNQSDPGSLTCCAIASGTPTRENVMRKNAVDSALMMQISKARCQMTPLILLRLLASRCGIVSQGPLTAAAWRISMQRRHAHSEPDGSDALLQSLIQTLNPPPPSGSSGRPSSDASGIPSGGGKHSPSAAAAVRPLPSDPKRPGSSSEGGAAVLQSGPNRDRGKQQGDPAVASSDKSPGASAVITPRQERAALSAVISQCLQVILKPEKDNIYYKQMLEAGVIPAEASNQKLNSHCISCCVQRIDHFFVLLRITVGKQQKTQKTFHQPSEKRGEIRIGQGIRQAA